LLAHKSREVTTISVSRKLSYAIIGIFAVFAAILIFDFCRFTIKSIKCWSNEYGPLYYLARCNDFNFGEYETGAIYYGLENGVSEGIRNAQVIFVGSSKLQQAFSTKATASYFAEQNIRFYVLGFAVQNSAGFVLPLLKDKRASPSLLVINADPFFIADPRANYVLMGGLRTYWRLAKMMGLQRLQRAICPSFPSFCSPPYRTIYRSANTGQWRWQGSYYPEQSIAFNELMPDEFSDDAFEAAIKFGPRFLREIKINRDCIVFTGVPNNEKEAPAIASRLAQRLGTHLILPKVEPIFLLDDYHLNFDSAERWSAAFLSELTPILQRCLSKTKDHD
jgi:hypothetical protein